MSVLDVDKLLAELSEDAPSGEDLEYDPAFTELERDTHGKAEQQFGDTIVPAEEPDWKAVKNKAIDLLGRTKDLRVGVQLVRALIRLDGFPGLADGLALLRGYIEKYWDTVHPQLDPDDANDPTMRVNTFLTICDPDNGTLTGTTLRYILDTPIVKHKVIGVFSLHDIQMSDGTRPLLPELEGPPDAGSIDAAFMEVELEELQATANAVNAAVEHSAAIDSGLTAAVGAAEAADLAGLAKLLREVDAVMVDRLGRRGVSAEPQAETEGDVEEASGAGGGGAAQAQAMSFSGTITTREEVVKMLDKVIDYFGRHEPSNPIPLLLHRAKRLVSKSFMEIMQDLAPEGLAQAMMMVGVKDEPPAQ